MVDRLSWRYPGVKLLLASPAVQACALVGQQFPVLRVPSVVDAQPAHAARAQAMESMAWQAATTASEAAAIEVRARRKHYGALRAVDGVDLTVRRGEIFGLIGHNGAGKSTLFKMMLGLIAPTDGEILIDGCSVRGRGFRAVRRRIGYLPENVVLYDNLTGLETLHFFARLKGAPRAQCAPLLRTRRPGGARRNARCASTPRACANGSVLPRPCSARRGCCFWTNPTNGLDPQAIRDFYALLDEQRAQGVTVLITSHILAELQERVDRLAIMANWPHPGDWAACRRCASRCRCR